MKLFLLATGIFLTTSSFANIDKYTLSATTGTTPGKIDLNWTSTNSSVWYEIQRSFNGNDFFTISKAAPGILTYSDTGLYYNIRYWHRLIAHNPIDETTHTSNITSTLSQAALLNPYPIFQDSFDSQTINPAWSFIGGKWTQSNGLLAQIDDQISSDIKKAILIDQNYPSDQTMTAKVLVTSWLTGGGDHVGVGIYTDTQTGFGYQLVFHNQNQVQFVDDGVAWGNTFTFPWKTNVWYWFKLTSQAGTLLGKVWQDGTQEPANWMFTQSGWTHRTRGNPALNGGGLKNGFSTAIFDAVSVTGTISRTQPFAIGGDPSVNPANFRITTFASQLNYPYSMQQLADGSLLVSTSDPIPGGNYFASTGTLLRFIDANNDGIADGPGQIMYSGLPGSLTSLRTAGNLVLVTSSKQQHEAIWVLRMGATPSDPYTLVGSLSFSFPVASWDHTTYASIVRPTPGGNPGEYDFFFNVGSKYDAAPDQDTVGLSGLMTATLNSSSIYMIKIQDTGSSVNFSNLTQIANGVRNAAGMAFDPLTGDLYFEDNGMDFESYKDEPLSTDKIHMIPADLIGTQVFNFGFPYTYISYRTNQHIGPPAIEPLIAFQPWPDRMTGSESEGPVEIAIAPTLFPAGLNNGVFVGFFGRFNLGGYANEENPVVFYNRANGQYFHFISNSEPNIGHISGLLSTDKALFLSDMSSNGIVSTPNGTAMGAIYKIEAI